MPITDDVDIAEIPPGVKRIVLKTAAGKEQVITASDDLCPLTQALRRYYEDDIDAWNEACAIIQKRSVVSLRLLDWLVTNFSIEHTVFYRVGDEPFELSSAYRCMLRGFSKTNLDAFARTSRIIFEVNHARADVSRIFTSVGQLNFLKWAISHHVTEFARENAPAILRHMSQTAKARSAMRKPNCRVRAKMVAPMLRRLVLDQPVSPFGALGARSGGAESSGGAIITTRREPGGGLETGRELSHSGGALPSSC